MIVHEEISRWKVRGFDDGVLSGMFISLPTVLNFGSPHLKQKVAHQVFSGEKRICLAITEPYAGSDVARIRTTAKRTADGKHFIVNGVKKWITGGCWADYFSVAVQTEKGMSMLLVERSEGVETKLIKTSYSTSAGTAYVTFENVRLNNALCFPFFFSDLKFIGESTRREFTWTRKQGILCCPFKL